MKASVARKKPSRHDLRADPARSEAMIRLLHEWAADESGYDEKTWPVLKQAIEEHAPSARPRFRD